MPGYPCKVLPVRTSLPVLSLLQLNLGAGSTNVIVPLLGLMTKEGLLRLCCDAAGFER